MYSVLLDMVSRSMQSENVPALRPGAVLQGNVEGAPGRLTVVAGGMRVPLPESADFQPKQPVTIEAKHTPRGVQLLVKPAPLAAQPTPQPVAAKPEAGALAQLVKAALNAAGVAGKTDAAVQLVPASLPGTPSALAEFFAAYGNHAPLANDLEALKGIVSRAAKTGAVSARLASAFSEAASNSVAKDVSSLEALLHRLFADSAPAEARIAAALNSADGGTLEKAFQNDLNALLGKLRQDEGFNDFLRETGQARGFERQAGRILARISEAGVQNARSLDQPYMFVQVPFEPGAPIERANLHVMAESGGGPDAQERATVVLDVTTARLGDLWMSVVVDGPRCACRISARTEPAVDAIREAAGQLEESLRRGGYANASVYVTMWDGDRLAAAAEMLRPFAGLDVEA